MESRSARQTIARPKQRRSLDPSMVVALLRQRERAHRWKVWLSIVGGILLLPLGPLIIDGVIWIYYQEINVSYRSKFNRGYGFWSHYWIVAIYSLPILFALAALVKGNLLDAAAESSDESFRRAFVMRRAMVLLMLAEIGNIGPRLVLLGIRRARSRLALGKPDLDRLAAAVVTLGGYDESIATLKLLCPEESPDCLEQILPLLLYHELIDVSAKGERVWLCSTTKRRLRLE